MALAMRLFKTWIILSESKDKNRYIGIQRYVKRQSSCIGHRFLIIGNGLNNFIQITGLEIQDAFPGFHMRQIEDIVDQTVQPVDVVFGPAQKIFCSWVVSPAVPLMTISIAALIEASGVLNSWESVELNCF